MKNGVIIINKEEGISSFKAVRRVQALFSADKAGHTGTLDPLATGVLPVLLGRGVKASEYMLSADKHYIATLLLGVSTDTEDVTGRIISSSDEIPSEKEVLRAVNSMLGESEQVPPMYSALKVGGKKLYELARAGERIEREPRKITVYSISARRLSNVEYELDVKCSKGTYIRTLCADIGARLGCGGAMKTLTRASAAGFSLADACTVGELEKMSEAEREARVLPIEAIFSNLRRVLLPDFFARLAHSGAEIYLKKINMDGRVGERVTLFDANGFFALGEIREFDSGIAIKPIKQFTV